MINTNPNECCKIVTINSTLKAEAIIDNPGRLTVHCFVLFKKKKINQSNKIKMMK